MSKLIGSKFCHFFHTTPTQRRRRRRQINFNHLPNGGGSDGLAVIEDDVIQRQKLILSQNFGKQLIGHGLDLVQEQEVQVRKVISCLSVLEHTEYWNESLLPHRLLRFQSSSFLSLRNRPVSRTVGIEFFKFFWSHFTYFSLFSL